MGIYVRSPHQQFTLKAGSASIANRSFAGPWEAYGVVVNNYTNQHVYLPDVNWYVPPGVIGATVPLPALMQASASLAAPPGLTNPAPITGQIATLDYFAEELAPYPGVPTGLGILTVQNPGGVSILTVLGPYATPKATFFLSAASVSKVFGAGTTLQLAVVYHDIIQQAEQLAIRKIVMTIESITAASVLVLSVAKLDGITPPSGGVVMSTVQANSGDAVPSDGLHDVFRTYPTTPGSVAAGLAVAQSYSLAISANPTDVTKLQPITLYDWKPSPDTEPLTLRPGIAEGWAVQIGSSGAATIIATITMEITKQ